MEHAVIFVCITMQLKSALYCSDTYDINVFLLLTSVDRLYFIGDMKFSQQNYILRILSSGFPEDEGHRSIRNAGI
jgi:hypothetical protein